MSQQGHILCGPAGQSMCHGYSRREELTVFYRKDLLPFFSDPEFFFILPANQLLRIGGFPFSIPWKIYGAGIQASLNQIASSEKITVWEPVHCKNMLLVPGELGETPDPGILYQKILGYLLQHNVSKCCIYPVTVPWGFSVQNETDEISRLRKESFTVVTVLENRREYRFPHSFYNSLKRELFRMRDCGSTGDQLYRHAVMRARENDIDEELLLYCLGLRDEKTD